MKTLIKIIFLGLSLASLTCNAQVENRALLFTPDGFVDCGGIPLLKDKGSYSLQFWINPSKWIPNASLLSIGDNFNVKLDNPGLIVFNSGNSSIPVYSPSLKSDEWNQITMTCKDGETSIWINGEVAVEGKLAPISIENTEAPLKLGGGYEGMIDEVRIWDDALNDEMKTFDFFIFNTLNKFCPMWDNLLVYYKMDQPLCDNLVNYKDIEDNQKDYDNHGIFTGDVKRVKANNLKMPYLINSAYTENPRFYRHNIPADQYLLSNELIILGTDVFADDGRIETKTPNNHGLSINNINYLSEYEGRNGVLSFNNENSNILLPDKTLNSDAFTFETWLNLDEIVAGAELLDKDNQLSIYFGSDLNKPTLIIESNNIEIESEVLSIPVSRWFHLAVTSEELKENSSNVSFYMDGKKFEGTKNSSLPFKPLSFDDEKIVIGEKIKGKLDDLVIWNKSFSEEEIKDHFNKGIPMPGYGYPVSNEDMRNIGGYYKFDNEDNLAYSSYSQDEWLNIMKKIYEGRQGMKYYISVQGTYRVRPEYGDWREILDNPQKRKRFASDLAKISIPYDGVELDLEWIENPEQWELFGTLAMEIKEELPSEKDFRISLHNNYTDFPIDKMEYVDGFTFQQYGPNNKNFSYDNFINNVEKFIGKFDKKKIMTSYSTTTSKSQEGSPVRLLKGEILDNYSLNDNDTDIFLEKGDVWNYMGPYQVYKRAKHTRDKNLSGIFYWDLADDNWNVESGEPEIAKFNQAKFASFGINANNDPLIDNLKVIHFQPK